MTRSFCKMQGAGNDYIYFDCLDEGLEDPASLAVRLSDRHFSVGGDGIVLILPGTAADARMRMFNADGSEGAMCGNAIRCVGKYLYEKRGMKKPVLSVETASGVKTLLLHTEGEEVVSVSVGMGKPRFRPEEIPALFQGEKVVNEPLSVGGKTYRVTCLSMGNPHCVVFCDEVKGLPLSRLGPLFERHPVFPERVNTEFVRIAGENRLEMRVWERGSGETLACGTGACASAVASFLPGHCGREVTVQTRGGELIVSYSEEVWLRGPAAFCFAGEVEL